MTSNREIRLQEILRVFAALDTGDEPYWWTPDRQGLVQYARQELTGKPTAGSAVVPTDAAPQTEAGQRFPVPQHEDATQSSGSAVAAPVAPAPASDTPLTDANVLAEIPGQMWVDSQGQVRDRVLGDFARHLEIELRMAFAVRDHEWVKAIHDACGNISPADPQGKPVDPADIKRCVHSYIRVRLGATTAKP